MYSDPILREVHRMKDQFARKVDYDIGKLFKRLHKDAKKHPERMVQPEPKSANRDKAQTSRKRTAE